MPEPVTAIGEFNASAACAGGGAPSPHPVLDRKERIGPRWDGIDCCTGISVALTARFRSAGGHQLWNARVEHISSVFSGESGRRLALGRAHRKGALPGPPERRLGLAEAIGHPAVSARYSITSSARRLNRRGYGKAKRLGGFAVHDHLEFCRQLGDCPASREERLPCCALAASGHDTAAPPSPAMNSRHRRQMPICASVWEALSRENSTAQACGPYP
jgi:hypothetical protein